MENRINDLKRLQRLALTWGGLFAALVVALFLQRLLPEHRKCRGRATIAVLIAAPLLHFVTPVW